ncbi:MAG: hypothetical protein DRP97_01405, partial [Candidatus Latescibacterota bacterium]
MVPPTVFTVYSNTAQRPPGTSRTKETFGDTRHVDLGLVIGGPFTRSRYICDCEEWAKKIASAEKGRSPSEYGPNQKKCLQIPQDSVPLEILRTGAREVYGKGVSPQRPQEFPQRAIYASRFTQGGFLLADSSRTASLRKILKFVRPFKRKIVSAIILTVLLNLIGQIPPWIQKFFIDRVITGGEWHFLIGIVAAMLSIPLVSYLLSFWNNFIITYVGQKLVFDIRRALYEHLMRLSLRFHGNMGTGKVISRLMGDSATIQNMMTLNTISMVNNLISFSIGIVVIFYFNWKLSLVTLVILPLHWLNYHFFVKRIRHKTRRIRRKWDQIYNQTYERLSGTKLVQTFTKEEVEAEEFVTETTETMGLRMENVALSTSFGGLSGL